MRARQNHQQTQLEYEAHAMDPRYANPISYLLLHQLQKQAADCYRYEEASL